MYNIDKLITLIVGSKSKLIIGLAPLYEQDLFFIFHKFLRKSRNIVSRNHVGIHRTLFKIVFMIVTLNNVIFIKIILINSSSVISNSLASGLTFFVI